jgi:hypothetical protein
MNSNALKAICALIGLVVVPLVVFRKPLSQYFSGLWRQYRRKRLARKMRRTSDYAQRVYGQFAVEAHRASEAFTELICALDELARASRTTGSTEEGAV